jgi:hypothetical protein
MRSHSHILLLKTHFNFIFPSLLMSAKRYLPLTIFDHNSVRISYPPIYAVYSAYFIWLIFADKEVFIILHNWCRAPIAVAARSKAWPVFARSNAGVVGSNPTRGMDVCENLFCHCVVLWSRDSSVRIATGYGLDDQGGGGSSSSVRVKKYIHFSISFRLALGSTQHPTK